MLVDKGHWATRNIMQVWLIERLIHYPASVCRKILGDWRSFPACPHLAAESGVSFGIPYFI